MIVVSLYGEKAIYGIFTFLIDLFFLVCLGEFEFDYLNLPSCRSHIGIVWIWDERALCGLGGPWDNVYKPRPWPNGHVLLAGLNFLGFEIFQPPWGFLCSFVRMQAALMCNLLKFQVHTICVHAHVWRERERERVICENLVQNRLYFMFMHTTLLLSF